MNRLPIILLFFAASHLFADESDEPFFHFFTVPSPSNTCYAVHTVRPWTRNTQIQQYGRIQVFNSDTGAELWRLEGVLFYASDVFPTDDRKHLVVICTDIPTRQAATIPAVLFYEENRLIHSYTLRDLGIDPTKLKHRFLTPVSPVPSTAKILGCGNILSMIPPPLFGNWGKKNPTWNGTVLDLETLDGQHLKFDYVTGKFLGAQAQAPK